LEETGLAAKSLAKAEKGKAGVDEDSRHRNKPRKKTALEAEGGSSRSSNGELRDDYSKKRGFEPDPSVSRGVE